MKKKKRKVCFNCKAKKYVKYLAENLKGKWVCKNKDKCENRGANYKK